MTTTSDCELKNTPTKLSCRILSWGANSYGQLSQGTKDDELEPKPIVDIADKIVFITGGGGHTLAITDDGKLLTCGSNSKGQLGLNHTEDITVLTHVEELKDKVISQVTGGWDFTIAVASHPQGDAVYSWGSNSLNQLGRCSKPSNFSSTPASICLWSDIQGQKIRAIAAGLRHSMMLTEQGTVYSWGHGKKGQLGYLLPDKSIPKTVQVPTKVDLPEPVSKIFCGSYFSGALSGEGNLYMWGCNKYGQIAQSMPVASSSLPMKIPNSVFNTKIKDISCGWTHVVALTDDGSVYVWGRGDYGQLGRKVHGTSDFTPAKIHIHQPIRQIVCGSEHNLAIDRNVLSWGWNEHGMCGTGDEENVFTPTTVKKLTETKAEMIGSGAGHCFVLLQDTWR